MSLYLSFISGKMTDNRGGPEERGSQQRPGGVGIGSLDSRGYRRLLHSFWNLVNTVEPPIKDPLRIEITSLQRTCFKIPTAPFPILLIHQFWTSEQTSSLQRTKWLAPTCPLFSSSTVVIICASIINGTRQVILRICLNLVVWIEHNRIIILLTQLACECTRWSIVNSLTHLEALL